MYVTVVEQDVRCMSFEDNSFKYVIDKGTLDAILCDHDEGAPEIHAERMLHEIVRVLRPVLSPLGFISLSYLIFVLLLQY
jgi:hypothetical protein